MVNIRKTSAAYQERIAFRAECEAQSIKIICEDEIKKKLGKIFNNDKEECVYCGDDKRLTWDHLVPITPPNGGKEIGHSVTGNLVRACLSCNSSKGNKEFQAWMKSGTPKAPAPKVAAERIPKLKCYQDLMKCSSEFEKKRNKLEEYKSEIKVKTGKIEQLRNDLKEALEELEDFINKEVLS